MVVFAGMGAVFVLDATRASTMIVFAAVGGVFVVGGIDYVGVGPECGDCILD